MGIKAVEETTAGDKDAGLRLLQLAMEAYEHALAAQPVIHIV